MRYIIIFLAAICMMLEMWDEGYMAEIEGWE